jgi:hypothetical protein
VPESGHPPDKKAGSKVSVGVAGVWPLLGLTESHLCPEGTLVLMAKLVGPWLLEIGNGKETG